MHTRHVHTHTHTTETQTRHLELQGQLQEVQGHAIQIPLPHAILTQPPSLTLFRPLPVLAFAAHPPACSQAVLCGEAARRIIASARATLRLQQHERHLHHTSMRDTYITRA